MVANEMHCKGQQALAEKKYIQAQEFFRKKLHDALMNHELASKDRDAAILDVLYGHIKVAECSACLGDMQECRQWYLCAEDFLHKMTGESGQAALACQRFKQLIDQEKQSLRSQYPSL